MEERILELAMAASGTGDETLLTPLCAAARRAWLVRLREDVTPEDCGEALVCAAAFTAAANLAAGGGVASFSAGDLSVGRREGGGAAENLRRAAEGLMEPYVRAAGLWVKGAEG